MTDRSHNRLKWKAFLQRHFRRSSDRSSREYLMMAFLPLEVPSCVGGRSPTNTGQVKQTK